jgi:hypothetical protein
MSLIIPKICEKLLGWSELLQTEAGKSLKRVLPRMPETKDAEIYEVTQKILQSRTC